MMKPDNRLMWIVGLVCLVGLVGCNLPMNNPAGTTPTAFAFPTQNLTLTALFEPPVVIPPTVTPGIGPGETVVLPTEPGPAVATATQAPPTATPTQAAATATTASSPTKTTAQTNQRVSPSAIAPFVSTPPKIDGDWGEWSDSKQYPLTAVVFGAKNWSNANDLEASYQVAWDNTNLYLAVKVHDDKYVQGATGKDMYKGDSVEILVDTNVSGDFYTQSLSADDYQLGFSPGNPIGKNTESYLWYPSSKSGKPSGVNLAAVAGEGIWRVEAAIPWSILGVSPADEMHLGFAVSVSDNDAGGENLQQSMVSSAAARSLVDPTTWGDLTLQK